MLTKSSLEKNLEQFDIKYFSNNDGVLIVLFQLPQGSTTQVFLHLEDAKLTSKQFHRSFVSLLLFDHQAVLDGFAEIDRTGKIPDIQMDKSSQSLWERLSRESHLSESDSTFSVFDVLFWGGLLLFIVFLLSR